jgi:hypothetical protein
MMKNFATFGVTYARQGTRPGKFENKIDCRSMVSVEKRQIGRMHYQ